MNKVNERWKKRNQKYEKRSKNMVSSKVFIKSSITEGHEGKRIMKCETKAQKYTYNLRNFIMWKQK